MSTNSNISESKQLCQKVIDDIVGIVAILEKNLGIPDLHKKIDIVFYFEKSLEAKIIYKQLNELESPDPMIHNDILEIYSTIKTRWSNDFKFVASPPSLHDHLSEGGKVSVEAIMHGYYNTNNN